MGGRRIVFDKETTGLLDHTSIDYSSMPYKLLPTFKTHCICVKDVDTKEKFHWIQDDCANFISWVVNEVDVIIGHNIVGFDLISLYLCFGLKYEIYPDMYKRLSINDDIEEFPDIFQDKKVKIIDTLVLSKLFNPDRYDRCGKHSLEAWGKRLNILKGDYGKQQDAWDVFTDDMLEYCHQDCEVTEAVYSYLMSTEAYDGWEEAYYLEAIVRHIISYAEHYGFKFDNNLAEWCIDDLNKKIKVIEDLIEPTLPERVLPKGQQPKFPKRIWKNLWPDEPYTAKGPLNKKAKDYLTILGIPEDEMEDYVIKNEIPKHKGCLSASAITYGEKIGVTDKEELFSLLNDEDFEPPIITEPMRLSNDDDIKQYLINEGWEPTVWNDSDLLLNSKKKKKTKEQIIKSIDLYVDKTLNSAYCKYRCKFLKCKPKELKNTLIEKSNSAKTLKVLSTPKFTIDQNKTLCPGLDRLGEKFHWVEEFVKYLTYSHRKNTILSDNGTGWLAHERIGIDGHIPTPADTLHCNTSRMSHRVIVNCPRVTTLYGEYMRAMLSVRESQYLLGYDAAALENRIQGHYVFKYPGGEIEKNKLIGDKPNDCHTVLAEEVGISRDEAKKVAYMVLYGAQPNKISKDIGWSVSHATTIFNDFWSVKPALKELREAVVAHWEKQNRKCIIGIDKRRLPSRAQHSLLNLLFQSSGVICMKRAMVMQYQLMKEQGILGNPFEENLDIVNKAVIVISMHDECQISVGKGLVRFKYFNSKSEAKKYLEDADSKYIFSNISEKVLDNGEKQCYIAWSKVGEISVNSLLAAGEYYDLNVPLTSDYVVGKNWAETH